MHTLKNNFHGQKGQVPYTFARISVMRSNLITKHEYHKLLKMDLAEITRYLQDSNYKDSLTKLSVKYEGMELVEQALRRNQRLTFAKLRRISPGPVINIIDLYLMRYDFQNLKVVLRGIYSNADKETVKRLVETVGRYSNSFYIQLFETGEIEKAIKKAGFVKMSDIQPGLKKFKEDNQLVELENQLDRIYYMQAVECTKELNSYGQRFKDLLLRNVDVVNIKNLLRFKQEGLNAKEIMNYMIFSGEHFSQAKLSQLANEASVNEIIKSLQQSSFNKYVEIKEDDAIFDIETKLDTYLIKQALKKNYRNIMSINTVLVFLISKVNEIRNLRSIIKSKHLGISPEFIEQKLLVV